MKPSSSSHTAVGRLAATSGHQRHSVGADGGGGEKTAVVEGSEVSGPLLRSRFDVDEPIAESYRTNGRRIQPLRSRRP